SFPAKVKSDSVARYRALGHGFRPRAISSNVCFRVGRTCLPADRQSCVRLGCFQDESVVTPSRRQRWGKCVLTDVVVLAGMRSVEIHLPDNGIAASVAYIRNALPVRREPGARVPPIALGELNCL